MNKNFFKKCDPCPKGVRCVPSIECPAHVRMKPNEKPQICDLPHGGHGYCCTSGRNHTKSDHRKWRQILYRYNENALFSNIIFNSFLLSDSNLPEHNEAPSKRSSSARAANSKSGEKNGIMMSVVAEARSHFTGMLNQESKSATLPKDHPGFMHHLVFRLVQAKFLCVLIFTSL